ncbi:reverse transcriptase domain-containing protein [Tanacetum coccineum]
MPNNVKTYDGIRDLEDHVKIFQAAAQVERWAMPTWCHMFNSTLIGAARVWFDELPTESIDGYKDLKADFLAYFMQQKKYVKDPVEIHNIKQREGEIIEEFMERFKVETGRIKGAPECMRISGFMHGVNKPELTKRLNEYVPKTMEEMMITTTAFIRGEAAAAGKKKVTHCGGHKTSQSGTVQSEGLTFEVSQGMDGGLPSLPPIQEHPKKSSRPKQESSNRHPLCSGTECPLVIEAEIGGHMIHRMSLSPHNGIIGRPRIREIQAVPSTAHGMLKFPVDGGIVTILALHPNFPDQEVAIGGTLSAKGRMELCSLLKKILDIFAWKPSDMTRVPRSIAEHRLNIQEGYSLIRQKKRGQAPKRTKAIQAEVQKLVEAGIMREVYYHEWLSNPVMVKKHDGYHQIQMAESDEEKTAFHTSQGVYCYTKMPFNLKNAGATYQRLMDKAFDSQVCRDIEVYVDDLVIKIHTEAEMLRDVDEMFHTDKSCPDKTEAVLQLPSPRTIKEVQSLNRKLASLNRFLSKSARRSLQLFKTLKKCIKKSDFHWTPEAEQAFKQLKQHLSDLPLLVAPKPKEELIIYLSATDEAISAVLMTERSTVQTPVYFILADFLVEKSDENPLDTSIVETPQEPWTLFIDGSSCVDGSGVGLILTSPEGTEFTYVLRFQFTTSNNEAEYKALIAGLRIAAQMGVRNVQAKSLISGFANFSISQVPRSKNKKADALSKIASTSFAHLSKHVLGEILKEKSIQEKEVEAIVEEEGPTWMTLIIKYLKDGTLLGDRKEASKLRIKATIRIVGRVSLYAVIPKAVTKIKAKAVATITGNQVKKFVWDNIVYRFDLPGEIISNNGKEFSDNPFKDWCEKLNIAQRFASVKHPQSNGLVERENQSLGEGIKARLGEGNKN